MVKVSPNGDIIFRYRNIQISIPAYSFFIPYATFFAGEYDFLKPRKKDTVIDAGAT